MIYSLINDISVFLMNEELNFQLQIVLSAHKSILDGGQIILANVLIKKK